MNELLQQGIAAYKAGKRDQARKIFISVLKQDPESERAWGWMYIASGNDEERIFCLKQILRINPKNEKAAQLLKKFSESTIPVEQPSPQPAKLETHETAERTPLSGHQTTSPSINNNQRSSNNKLVLAIIAGGIAVSCLSLISIGITKLSPKFMTVPTLGSLSSHHTEPAENQVLSGTQTEQATPTQTNTPIPQPTHTSTSVFTLTPPIAIPTQVALPASVASCIPQNTSRQTGFVTGIIDGDTIDVKINEQIYRLRYIGINTPERNETFYEQASLSNQNLVYLKSVTLIKDISETDRYSRILRYVIVGDVFVNYELVRQGYAQASTYPPDVACSEFFANAQRQAQAENAGLWSPLAMPTAVSSGSGDSGNCSPAYPTVCIPPPPPDLDCKDISYRRFQVLPPDPHHFDGDGDGVGCES
jgi:micrococcal nuclease